MTSVLGRPQPAAFISTLKGFCYVTIKRGGRHVRIFRVRKYRLDVQEKRDLPRLWPVSLMERHLGVAFPSENAHILRIQI
jgi:hypothetical protein